MRNPPFWLILVLLLGFIATLTVLTLSAETPSAPSYTIFALGPPPPLPGDPEWMSGASGDDPFGDATPPVTSFAGAWQNSDSWAHSINELNQVAGLAMTLDGAHAVFLYGPGPTGWEFFPLEKHRFVESFRGPSDFGPELNASGTVAITLHPADTYEPFTSWVSEYSTSLSSPLTPEWGFKLALEEDVNVFVRGITTSGGLALTVQESVGIEMANAAFLEADETLTVIQEGFARTVAANANGAVLGYSVVPDEQWEGEFYTVWWTWKDGTMQELPGKVGTASHSLNNDINEQGDVLNYGGLLRDGVILDVEDLLNEAGLSPYPRLSEVNSHGDVVGWGWKEGEPWPPSDWDDSLAYLMKDGQVYFLDDLVADKSWRINYAMDINDAGFIVGSAERNGRQHAVMLLPVNAPGDGE